VTRSRPAINQWVSAAGAGGLWISLYGGAQVLRIEQ